MRVLVTGGRQRDPFEVERVVLFYVFRHMPSSRERVIIIHGDAKGADQGAHRASMRDDFGEFRLPAQWQWFGKGAGPARNREMLDVMEPDVVLAFPSIRAPSPGTWGMVFLAKERNIPVEVFNERCNPEGDYHASPHVGCILR